ncbi:MAG: hypothetical protein JW955_25840 [Sedimentisphaerales bacterium]|nr:hypothetical protein [Sedimentisphaerales bacterium]
MLIVFAGLFASLSSLPVAACVAVVGKHRCRTCGHRFAFVRGSRPNKAAPGFLWRWCVLSFAVLFLLCVIVPMWVRARAAGTGLGLDLPVVNSIVEFGLSLWVSVIFQVVTYLALRRHLRVQLAWAVLLMLPALVMGARSVYLSQPAVRVRMLLARIGTAALPPSARDVRVLARWCPDQSDIYICFAAGSGDVTRFLDESLILKDAEYERFPAEEVIVIGPGGPSSPEEYASYRAQRDGPEWFRRRLMVPTRRYHVRPEGHSCRVEVTVDDQRNTVFVHLRGFPEPPPRRKGSRSARQARGAG